jgi:hypothetical protein
VPEEDFICIGKGNEISTPHRSGFKKDLVELSADLRGVEDTGTPQHAQQLE